MLSQESLIVGELRNSISASDTTFYIRFDRKLKNGAILEEGIELQSNDYIFTFDRENNNFEYIYIPDSARSYNATTGITTCSGVAIVRGLSLHTADIETEVTANKKPHTIGSTVEITTNHFLNSISQSIFSGSVKTGANEFYLGDGTDGDIIFGYIDSAGNKKGLVKRNYSTDKSQYSNDGTTWVDIDQPAPSNITLRSVTPASANNNEIFINASDSPQIYFKDNSGDSFKVFDITNNIVEVKLKSNGGLQKDSTNGYAVKESDLSLANLGEKSFESLSDGFTFSGNSEKVVRVNTGETALEPVSLSSFTKMEKVDTDTSILNISNTTTETTIFTTTLEGGILGTNNAVKIKTFFRQFNTSAGRTMTFRLKYGGTTILTKSGISALSDSSGMGECFLEFTLMGRGTTSSQRVIMILQPTELGNGVQAFEYADSSVDSTTDKTLEVTAQWNNTGGSLNSVGSYCYAIK